MFKVNDKLEFQTRELERFRYVNMQTIMPMRAVVDSEDSNAVHRGVPVNLSESNDYLANLGDLFIGRDRYLWLQKTVSIPDRATGCDVVGIFDFGTTGSGSNSGFESLLYVNCQPYQGVDTNHQDVVLNAFSGQTVELTFLLWSGLEGGGTPREMVHEFRRAEIGYLHEETDQYYYYAKAIYKALRLLPDDSSDRIWLTAALEKSLKLLNWDEDMFYTTIGSALNCLREELNKHEKVSDITVHCIGHTHIDVAWMWRLKHTREKAMRSFSTVMRLMEEFDEYIFLQSQPQLYQYLKQDCPELYEKIRDKVAVGKWEVDGGMWLEADCNVTSGESLVRQFLHGIRFFEKEFGSRCQYLWLPDVFGYSWALPQLMKQCGLKTFVTTKISWNQYNSMPHDLFVWRGIDGSEVLTYFIDTPEVGRRLDEPYSTYNGHISPRTVLGSWKKFKDKELSRDILISYGFGDGGGGVNRNMLKMRRVLDALPGLPHVKTGKATDFFETIHKNVAGCESYVPVWDGELFLEYHQGTYTTQAYNKKMNRYLEYRLVECEWLSMLSVLSGGVYDRQTLHDCWEIVLRNQFHDIIPGSSIAEVYQDSTKEYESVCRSLEMMYKTIAARVADGKENAFTVYNPGSFDRNGLVWLAVAGEGSFYDQSDNLLLAQKGDKGYWVAVDVKALCLTNVLFKPAHHACSESLSVPFQIDMDNRVIETPHYVIEWYAGGMLRRIYDKDHSREVMRENGRGNILEIYEDKPVDFDAWNIDLSHIQKCETLKSSSTQIIENGTLRAVIRFTYAYHNSAVVQDMIVYKNSRRIDFKTTVDWYENHRLLKAAFAVDVRSVKATYDIQFGHVERPTHFNTSWDYARYEVAGQKWADLSDGSYGVSLLNNCKYGYSIKDNVMRLSLLRGSTYPNPSADSGRHEFTYSLLPHNGTVVQGDTLQESIALNQALDSFSGNSPLANRQLVKFDNVAVHIDAVKMSEEGDALIVRLHECRGTMVQSCLTSDFHWKSWVECSILEEPVGESMSFSTINVCLQPFEIRTYRISLA